MENLPTDLIKISDELKSSNNQWEWKVAKAICEIPEGYLASYGLLASYVDKKHKLSIMPRTVASLRKKLYKKSDVEDLEIRSYRKRW